MLSKEDKDEIKASMNASDAFEHLFQTAKHKGETDFEFIERQVLRESLERQIKEAGLTPADLLKPMNPDAR